MKIGAKTKLGEREKTYPNPSLKGGAFKPGRQRLPL